MSFFAASGVAEMLTSRRFMMRLLLLVTLTSPMTWAQTSTTRAESTLITSAAPARRHPAVTAPPQYTNIWIDNVPAYQTIQQCAKQPLAQIVKDMFSGCGVPGPVYTSFECFCTSSSSTMNWIIDSAIMSACTADAAASPTASQLASSALQVFHSYCELPVIMAASLTTSASASAAMSTSSFSMTTLAPSTTALTAAAQTSTAPSKSLSGGAIAGIVLGGVATAMLIIPLAIFCNTKLRSRLLHRRLKPANPSTDAGSLPLEPIAHSQAMGAKAELDATCSASVQVFEASAEPPSRV